MVMAECSYQRVIPILLAKNCCLKLVWVDIQREAKVENGHF